jgi:hypothetical protein
MAKREGAYLATTLASGATVARAALASTLMGVDGSLKVTGMTKSGWRVR